MVKNSHYLARHLTKPWEVGERKLRRYDVSGDLFALSPSRNLFALDTPYPDHVEILLNKEVESPLARFVGRLGVDPAARPTEAELRALKLAILLQGVRTGTNRKVPDAVQDLHDIGQKDGT